MTDDGLRATRLSDSPPIAVAEPQSQPSQRSAPEVPPRRYGRGDLIGGKYRLEAPIGAGGMGEVWTAHNEMLGVVRAIKLISSEYDTPEATDRLLHEAQAAARLVDPAIVRVFDFGKTSVGDPYLVMELLEGEELVNVLGRREGLSATRAVRILLPVLRALAMAHLHGIVHRDLKPENIFLTKLQDGRIQPKLLDFGIAKFKDIRSMRLTTAGTVMGSPLYMSPEQARGEEVDERSDVWSVCVVLYELVAGRMPFMGDSRAEVFRAAMSGPPPSLAGVGGADEALWQIVKAGLNRHRTERIASAQDLGQQLAGWLLSQRVKEDITGASLEAGWFRQGPQSFFSSTIPPERRSGSMRPPLAIIDKEEAGEEVAPARDAQQWRERLAAVLDGVTVTKAQAAAQRVWSDKSSRVGVLATGATLCLMLALALFARTETVPPEPDPATSPPVTAPAVPGPVPEASMASDEGAAEASTPAVGDESVDIEFLEGEKEQSTSDIEGDSTAESADPGNAPSGARPRVRRRNVASSPKQGARRRKLMNPYQ